MAFLVFIPGNRRKARLSRWRCHLQRKGVLHLEEEHVEEPLIQRLLSGSSSNRCEEAFLTF